MIDWICERLALEDNESLSYHLVITVSKKSIVNRLEMQYK